MGDRIWVFVELSPGTGTILLGKLVHEPPVLLLGQLLPQVGTHPFSSLF